MKLKNGFNLHIRIDTAFGCTDEMKDEGYDFKEEGVNPNDFFEFIDLITPTIIDYIDNFGVPSTSNSLYFWWDNISPKKLDSCGDRFCDYGPLSIGLVNFGYRANTLEILLKK